MDKRNNYLSKYVKIVLGSAIWIICIVTIALLANTRSFIAPQSTSPNTESHGIATTMPGTEVTSTEDPAEILRETIDTTVSNWLSGAITFEEASSILTNLQSAGSGYPFNYAEEQLVFITIENEGQIVLEQAEELLHAKNYTTLLTLLNRVDQAYSKYSDILDSYDRCEKIILQDVATPASKEDFEKHIQLLEDCQRIHYSTNLSVRKIQLTEEFTIFLDVSETIELATVQFDSHNIEEALVLLALGLNKYPENEMLATALVNYSDHYIITTTREVVSLCEQEEYSDALQLVDAAIEEYDCAEFHMLREAVREEKSFLYRLKNDIVAAFTSFTQGWTQEDFDVKQAANNAGTYIVKSGKKLALGDYSDEHVTLLSFSGNVAASLLGVDLLFDLRDLSYDITHWGEEEYFAVWLAADVVALLPVIGVVKYFSHFETAKNGLEAASELVDSAGDIAKNTENAAELLDTISEVTKAGDDIADAIDNAKDAAKAGEAAKDILIDVAKEYTILKTINQELLGTAHEKTGIKFVLSKIELSDGRKLQGVFPKFDSFADIELPKELYKADFNSQKKECLEQLQKKLKNPFSKLHDKFTEDQIEDIMNGILPDGFTWHHNEQEGLMQLVDTVIHNQTNHTGGMSIWGRGY